MSRFKLLFFVLMLSAVSSKAQIGILANGELAYDSTTTWLTELNLNRADVGNALERELLQKFVFGGRISSDAINNSGSNLNSQNQYEALSRGGFSLTKFRPDKKYGLLWSYGITDYNHFNFSSDLYDLLFRGNTHFGSETASLGPGSFSLNRYQSLSFGFVEQESGSFLTLGLVHGMNYTSYDFNQLDVTTVYEPVEGFEVPSEIILAAEQFQDARSGKAAGVGFVLNGAYNYRTEHGLISGRVRGFGVTRWNNLQKRDTTGQFNFSGFIWDYGEDNNLGDIVETLTDSISPAISIEDEWRLMPFELSVSFFSKAEKRLFTSFSAFYRYAPERLPQVMGRLNYSLGDKIIVWIHAGAGGSAESSLGLGSQFRIGDSAILTLGSNHLFGLVSKQGTSLSAYINLQWRL